MWHPYWLPKSNSHTNIYGDTDRITDANGRQKQNANARNHNCHNARHYTLYRHQDTHEYQHAYQKPHYHQDCYNYTYAHIAVSNTILQPNAFADKYPHAA
jgi:hypothetical protein